MSRFNVEAKNKWNFDIEEGRDGGEVVSILAFYSDDPFQILLATNFLVYVLNCEKMKINKEEARVGPFF